MSCPNAPFSCPPRPEQAEQGAALLHARALLHWRRDPSAARRLCRVATEALGPCRYCLQHQHSGRLLTAMLPTHCLYDLQHSDAQCSIAQQGSTGRSAAGHVEAESRTLMPGRLAPLGVTHEAACSPHASDAWQL